MSNRSGIEPSEELKQQWTRSVEDPQISIQDEQLVPAGSFPTTTDSSSSSPPTSNDEDEAQLKYDFELFNHEGVVEDKTPAYYLLRLTPPPSSTFLFLSYVPDAAPVRSKMLYASTRSTLARFLGDSRLSKTSLFATSPGELSYEAYEAQTRHEGAEKPMTAREAEAEAIRQAEREEAEKEEGGGEESRRQGRSMLFGAAGEATGEQGDGGEGGAPKGVLPWSDEAREAVKALGAGEKDVVILEIDVPNETVVLADSQPTDLTLPPSSPCYAFYRHAAGIVLIYSCPPTSPIKSRLLYSSAALVLYKVAAPHFAGVTVLKKLETDDPSEVSPAWVSSELGPLSTPPDETTDSPTSGTASGASTPKPLDGEEKPKFARPARPGRRR
ncbi:hypothetical protein JCM8097_008081 [Rhodosporidiobolus ruineniae]